MNAQERRYIHREIRVAIDDAAGQCPQLATQQPTLPDKPAQRPQLQSTFQKLKVAWGLITLLASVTGAVLTAYVALPSLSLSLPSASYRPTNPFTAIFVVTSSGYLPGINVQAECLQNRIEYVHPKDISSSGLQTVATKLGSIFRNESRTYSCPQVAWVKIIPRSLTPSEIKNMNQLDSSQSEQMSDQDMSFKLADFDLRFTYHVPLLPINWTAKYHVVGKPAQDGSFIWEEVPSK